MKLDRRTRIACVLAVVLVLVQLIVIRYGVYGPTKADPDKMSFKEKERYTRSQKMITKNHTADDHVTRAELARAMYALADVDKGDASSKNSHEGKIEDVKKSAAKEEIYWALDESIMYQTKTGKFSPNDKVKMEDLLIAIERMIAHERVTLPKPEESISKISDLKAADDYADRAIKKLHEAGILDGIGLELAPRDSVPYSDFLDILIRTENAMKEDKDRDAKKYQPIPEIDGLKKQFADTTKDMEGDFSLYVKCLDTGEELLVGNKQMVSASLIKIFVAGTYFDEIKKGNIKETYDSKDNLYRMIAESSNSSWLFLESFIAGDGSSGIAKVNAFCKKNKFNKTRRWINKDGQALNNYTSAKDVARVLNDIYYGKYVSKEASKTILDHMLHQSHQNKIPAGLPEGTKVANKTGELGQNEHDAAIVWTKKCTYIIVIMSEKTNYASVGYQQVADISKMVYEYLCK